MEARIVCSGLFQAYVGILTVLEALVSAPRSRSFKGHLKGFGGANTEQYSR